MKKILVLHTGGTISMAEDAKSGAVLPSEQNPLIEKTKEINHLADLIIEAPFNLPSPHISPKEMFQLKTRIDYHIANSSIEGVVITHGTDTLEETAYFLDLTIQTDIPIVITGAMRSSNEIGADGLYNFLTALRTAIHDHAKGKGVLVVLNDEIHAANNVTKTHTSNVSTFQSPQYGPIGIITKKEILFHHHPQLEKKLPIHTLNHRVELIKAYAGMDSMLFQALSHANIDGLVIEALGQGNLPPACIPGLMQLLQKNVPIVLVSRCFNGIVEDVYAYDGGGAQLKKMGIIFSNGLNGQKARIKLQLALETTKDLSIINELFQ
ncbi:asparaginase [Caldibacillus lycopersici]|uniref:asparaginase n=1 Tax=Perspicuibacillus lycopersici TaxID=1325689 RepID=A0AAE3IUN6_9BACI|nr:asparaginase [Perspicuibacillus lycopersici]MCU9613729.1 asparaginase [Perspicuibacillus lycopersici]